MALTSKVIAAIAASAITLATAAPTLAFPASSSVDNVTELSGGSLIEVQNRRGFYKQNGQPFYNGHQGFRKPRKGYRQYNGWWFPLAAFAAGAIVGQGMAQGRAAPPPPPPGGHFSPAHYQWCSRKYRSYRPSDNTYQPYNGPRRQCRSPY